jgi:hypothetical protein
MLGDLLLDGDGSDQLRPQCHHAHSSVPEFLDSHHHKSANMR